MAREELLSLLYLQHATSPELLSPAHGSPVAVQGWTCKDEALRFSGVAGRPLFTIPSKHGPSLN